MMKEQELRIGNWVKRQGLYKIVDAKYLYNLQPYYSDPIILTSEVLEWCGFTKGKVKGVSRLVDCLDDVDHNDKKRWTYYWDLKVPKNDHVQDLSTFNLVQFGKGADILWSHQWLRVKVKYLHQLQNLYFSLTGKELEIKITEPVL